MRYALANSKARLSLLSLTNPSGLVKLLQSPRLTFEFLRVSQAAPNPTLAGLICIGYNHINEKKGEEVQQEGSESEAWSRRNPGHTRRRYKIKGFRAACPKPRVSKEFMKTGSAAYLLVLVVLAAVSFLCFLL